ncbi:MAG: ester cyclase [Pseudomonadota bacterium]
MRLHALAAAVLLIFALPPLTHAQSDGKTAGEAARLFFEHYNDQNVPEMVAMFESEGVVEYVPFALSGPVEEIGPGSWGVLIDAFPDLRNQVHSIRETADGRVAYVDVNIQGRQTKDAFGVPNKGQTYDLRHMFVFNTNEQGKIIRVTSFWDNADWYRQLGKTNLD